MITLYMKDLWPFERGLIINHVDDKSEEILIKIQNLFSQLKCTGMDEYRSIYFKCIDEYHDEEGNVTDTYKTFEIIGSSMFENRDNEIQRSLVFTIGNGGIILGNFSNSLDDKQEVDAYDFLTNVYNQLKEVINDVDKYNEEIKENLPYENREGTISHKELNKITDALTYDIPKGFINLIDNNSPKKYDKMTLNIYGDIWGRAYKASHKEQYKDMSPVQVFMKQLFMNPNDYEMDTEAGFKKWLDDHQHYHGCDIVYARVSLWAKYRDGNYTVHLSCCGEPWLQSWINIYNELKNDVDIDKEMYHDILTYEDTIIISPKYSAYFTYSNSDIKQYITASLNIFEEEKIQEIINKVEWENINNHLIEKV